MNVIVHYPQNEEGIHELQRRVAKVYAQAVFDILRDLPCPKEQKTEIVRQIREQVVRQFGIQSGNQT